MSSGFEIGRVYNRRIDIHGRFGGQQQGGIITPAQHPIVMIVTGEEGLEHGYSDRYRDDGVFEYFGEGQVGDMQLRAGNRAIELGRDRNGPQRNAIVFELRSLEAVAQKVEEQPTPAYASLEELRTLAYAAGETFQKPSQGKRDIYQRSNDVRIYVRTRADGKCEGCTAAAPFLRPDGSPYLEPHHIRRPSDGGPDHPAYVIALCPIAIGAFISVLMVNPTTTS